MLSYNNITWVASDRLSKQLLDYIDQSPRKQEILSRMAAYLPCSLNSSSALGDEETDENSTRNVDSNLLYTIATNAEDLKLLLEAIPEKKRDKVLQGNKERGPVWHELYRQEKYESCAVIYNALPYRQQQQLLLEKVPIEGNNRTVLHDLLINHRLNNMLSARDDLDNLIGTIILRQLVVDEEDDAAYLAFLMIAKLDNNRGKAIIEQSNTTDPSGNTLLHHIASTNNHSTEKMFHVALGFYTRPDWLSKLKQTNHNGDTVLHCAYANSTIINTLLDKMLEWKFEFEYEGGGKRCLVDTLKQKNNQGNSVLHLAAAHSSEAFEAIKTSCQEKLALTADELNDILMVRNNEGRTAKEYVILNEALKKASDEEKKQEVRALDKAITVLRKAIQRLERHGKSLPESEKKVAIEQIVHLLNQQVDEFYKKVLTEGSNFEDFTAFALAFKTTLHGQDRLLNQQRKAWKPILANILIALTGVGAILLAARAAIKASYKGEERQKHPVSFFAHTASLKAVDAIEEKVEAIQEKRPRH